MTKDSKRPNPRLRQLREQACWSQEDLAERLGATTISVSRWERGVAFPNPYFRRKLCEIFNAPPDVLGLLHAGPAELADVEDVRLSAHAASMTPSAPGSGNAWPEAVALVPSPSPHKRIGREALLGMLRRLLLAEESVAPLALHGLPGVGKTAVAIDLAHDQELRARFPDGVLWAGLGRTPKVMGLLAAWGAALGMTSAQMRPLRSLDDWTTALRTAIGGRRLLLVIDDAWESEHALALKVGGARCGLVVTTRSAHLALRVAGERAFAVTELSEHEGLELLAQLAPDVVAAEPDASRALVRSVGGLPLALTALGHFLLTQAYSRQPRRVRAALERLRRAEERLRLAEPVAAADRPPNLPLDTPLSLQAAIEVSDQGLPTGARSALRALSVFPAKPNSFSEDAALAVCGEPVEAFDALCDAGLLEGVGPGRYTLHQTVADYARVHCDDDSAYERMVAYCVSFVGMHATDYASLEQEHENVLAALDAAYQRRLEHQLMRGVVAYAPFLLARGLYDTAETVLGQAREVGGRLPPDANGARISLYLGRAAEARGDLPSAEQWYEHGLSVARRLESPATDVLCALLAHRGEVAITNGHYLQAEPYLSEGITLARTLHDHQRLGLLLRLLGEVADCGGRFEQGDACYREGLEHARTAGDSETASALLQNLGVKAVKRGEYTLADELYAQGFAEAHRILHRQRMSALLNNMGALAQRRGQLAQAEKRYHESLAHARAINHPVRIINALQNLAALARERGEYTQASDALRESLEIAQRMGHSFLESESLYEWANVDLEQGRTNESEQLLKRGLAIAQHVGAQELQALMWHSLARVAAANGRLGQARRYALRSLRRLQAMRHEQAPDVARWLAHLPPTAVADRSRNDPVHTGDALGQPEDSAEPQA